MSERHQGAATVSFQVVHTSADLSGDDATVTELRERLNMLEGLLMEVANGAPLRADVISSLVGRSASPDGEKKDKHSDRPPRPPRPRSRSPTPDRPVRPTRRSASPRRPSPTPVNEPMVQDLAQHPGPNGDSGPMQDSGPSSDFAPGPMIFNYDTPVASASDRSQPSPLVQPYPPQSQYQYPADEVHGTLVIGKSGRSKWLGPTAGTEWLKNVSYLYNTPLTLQQEESNETPLHSPSPTRRNISLLGVPDTNTLFPFGHGSKVTASIKELVAGLPPGDEAGVLVDSYYRYFTWK